MLCWRDRWNDTPALVILATTPPENGVLVDAVLFVRENAGASAVLTDQNGAAWLVELPPVSEDDLPCVVVGPDLKLENYK